MTLKPEPVDDIFTRVRNAIQNNSLITNFADNSPERAITRDGFSNEIRELQHKALAVQLSARVAYAGRGTDSSEGAIDEEDLNDLGFSQSAIDAVDLDLLNSYMEAQDLDEIALKNSVQRDPGAKSTGQVTFTVAHDGVVVPKGTEVGTQPDADNDFLLFTTDSEVTPSSNSTTVTANITSAEVGGQYNVGSGTITYLPSPPPGVQSVTNNSATSGGEDEETNASLRNRTEQAIPSQSGGGTVAGIKGGLVAAFNGLTLADIEVDQFFDPSTPTDRQDSPYGDVIVDGGPSDQDIKDELDVLQPSSVQHYLVRPTQITVDVDADLEGSDINTGRVETDIENYLSGLSVNQDLFRDQVIFTIVNADDGINNISDLTITIIDETHIYDSDNSEGEGPSHPLYKLLAGDSMHGDNEEGGSGIVEVTDEDSNTYTEGTDYDEGTVDGSEQDAIDWGLGGSVPDEHDEFYVDYEIEEDIPVAQREKVVKGTVNVTVV